jgi:recombinational DNA repair protein RecR
MEDYFFIGDEWPDDIKQANFVKLLKLEKEDIILKAAKLIKRLQHADEEVATCLRCVNVDANHQKYVKPSRAQPCHRCFEYGEV